MPTRLLGHLERAHRGAALLEPAHQCGVGGSELLPGLDLFNLGPAIARDTPLPSGPFAVYVGMVALYAVLYSSIALLFGLILFEDRDLA